MKRIMSLMQLFLLVGMANIVFGQVYAYDTFTYEPGELLDEVALTYGFTGSWGAGGGIASNTTVEPASLVYPGIDTVLQNGSGMLQAFVPNFEGTRVGRFFDMEDALSDYNNGGVIGKNGQTIYLSFLMRTNYTSPFFGFEFKRNDLGDGGAILYIGNDMGGSRIQVCAFRDRNEDPSNIGVHLNFLGDATTETELYVVKIEFNEDGDDVTVYRQPALDAEPVKEPDLLNAGDLTFNAITFATWVDPSGRVAQFDEICVASTYKDAVRFYNTDAKANTPVPADGAVDIASAGTVNLSWNAGAGVDAVNYKVYVSDMLDDVIAEAPSALEGTTTESALAISGLETDSTYYWSVIESEDASDPNFDIPGVVWSFDTNKTYPVVGSQPQSLQVFAGENAEFTFDVTSVSQESYQWYDADGPISDGGNISGAKTATLKIADVEVENEGSFYCEVSNSAGTITSNTVNLMVKRLVGYWDLDYPGSADPNGMWLDLSNTGNDLKALSNVPDTFEWTVGADGTENGAAVFNGEFSLGTKKEDGTMNDIPVGDSPYTMSVWVKTSPKNEGFIGWGNYGNYNQVNALAIYSNDPGRVNNYWWDNDLSASRGYSLADENWHQIVATYDGATKVIYIDGIEAGSNNPLPHAVPSSINFHIGRTNTTGNGEFFAGALDEVKVYNYALTATEAAQSYVSIAGVDLCVVELEYDFNNNCKVDLEDLAMFMVEWLDCGLLPTCTNVVE